MKNRLAFGLILLLLAACSTSKSIEKELIASSGDNSFFTGVSVKNALTGASIIEYYSDKYFTPASNVKLFTLYASLKHLKDSVPSFEYSISGDSLFIKGSADPSFFNDSLHKNSLEFLSNKKYQVYLLDEDLHDDAYGAGWSWDDYAYGYMPEKSLFPLYGNTVSIQRDQKGLEIIPSFFEESVHLDDQPEKRREQDRNVFYINKSDKTIERSVPFKTSNQLVADLLSEKLGDKVTLISAEFKRNFKPFTELPYDSLYVKMMKESDNFIAEQLMLQVAYKVVRKYNVALAIDHVLDSSLVDLPQRPRWVDGSGLSRYNLFTPESMVFLLSKMYQEVPQKRLLSYFPQGGVDGTLEHSFKEQSYIQAKSGTLSNNYSLSGYLTTKKGTVLAFSYMNNHYQGSSNARKEEMSAFFRKLYEHY
ncbi:D-alanyl-D-alanine carboxypeptidase/D-alanyl-D-alanine endopeptidase [Lutimonas sp.]|uniref:D-alanyl-D-alanine carboxypeptidase/D-alanyl-D-alanine endopeptidase n=1 Tax=Lutimonas sp. TaxID=1872403 RepID=UPI003D9BF995